MLCVAQGFKNGMADVEPLGPIVAGVAVVTVALAWWLSAPSQDKKKRRNAQGVYELDAVFPVFGSFFDRVQNAHRMYDWMADYSRQFDEAAWVFRLPGQPDRIMFTAPEALEAISTEYFDNFRKGAYQIECITDMFGAGLVASDEARWYHQRKAAVKFFSAKTLRALMTDSMQKNMTKVCHVIDGKMAQGQQVDLKQLFMEFTMDTFAELGMGVDLKCIGAANPHPFQHALDVIAPLVSRRFRVPSWWWKAERRLNIGPEAVVAHHKTVVDQWLAETIDKILVSARSKSYRPNDSRIKSIVELFVEYGVDDAEGVQPEDLKHFLLTFVVAARDTTATTLSWLFYLLGQHPQVEERLRSELSSKVETHHSSGYLTSDHLKSTVYLDAVIRETIRLFPAASFTMRECVSDTEVCPGVMVRKGQLAGMCAYAVNRNPKVWGEDANTFRPERWIHPSTGELLHVPLTSFFSFGAGPRHCIGMNLAMLELRIVTANLLSRYQFEIDRCNDGSYVVAPTMQMKHPLRAMATPL